jgi:ABC-type dipeptide/oligopeptide/nickel transport system ATPase subunit
MVGTINSLKSFLGRISEMFAADSGNSKGLRLGFGRAEAVLLPRGSLFIKGRFAALDREINYTWARKGGRFFLYPRHESNPHIVISGMSGFGKSTLFKSLLLDIKESEIPCIIFDAHNEHSAAVSRIGGTVHNAVYSGINILELDGASISERISELSRLFRDVYLLGHIQATKLSECLWYTYRKSGARGMSDRELKSAPTIRNLLDEICIFIRNSKTVGERNTLLRLKDRISLLDSSAFNSTPISMKEMQGGIHSFALANMKSREAQLIYIGELLSRIYSTMHDSKREGMLRLYIMIDEAQFLTDDSNSNSIISKLIEEGRKYGIGVIIVTHAASTLNKKVMANASAFLTFYSREPSEVSYVTKVLSGSNAAMADALRNKMFRIAQNQAMLVSSRNRNPVLLSTPRFDEVAIEGNAALGEGEAKGLLMLHAKRPAAISELKRLNPGITDSVLSKLMQSGFLSRMKDDYDREEWVMCRNPSLSLEHELWVKRISELLAKDGIENRIIDNSNGPDISVINGNCKVAIEYETGSKSMESTLKMVESRLRSYPKVIIVTKDSLVGQYKKRLNLGGVEVIGTEGVVALPHLIIQPHT